MKGCRPLTEIEVKKMMTAFHGTYATRNKALFILGLRTGFRISELLSIRLRDVVANGEIVDLLRVERKSMKGKTEGRTIKLHNEARLVLSEWIRQLRDEGWLTDNSYLFQSREGGNSPITRQNASYLLKRAFREAGLSGPLGTHTMRKTFARRVKERAEELRDEGRNVEPLLIIQMALGHKNIKSTFMYLSFAENDVDEAILTC